MLTAQLRRILLALVVLNLVFVQITGAVGAGWMIPLVGLALAAPMLWGLQRHVLYRIVWNTALIAIFCLLLNDIRGSGIRYMLEDGLILAAFCQVHALNNLAKQSRPDLIFFNSFLIALVTGFFCQDIVYSGVFFGYAMVLVLALALSSASTIGNVPVRILPRAEFRRLLRRSGAQGAVVLVCTALVFTFCPRDFDREGLVDEKLVHDGEGAGEVAFADQIRFDRKNNAILTNRIVAKAHMLQGSGVDVSRYWRGATFTVLHRYGWVADTNPQNAANLMRQIDERWVQRSVGEFVRTGHRTVAALEVTLADQRALSLFVPAEANRIRFQCAAAPNIDGNFRLSHYDREIRYFLELGTKDEARGRMRGHPSRDHVELSRRAVPPAAFDLDVELRRHLQRPGSRRGTVETIRRFLATERRYLLPGEPGAADDLPGFVAGAGGGHCEYFATTMVILLRLHDIPCRMVSGYLAHEWDDAGNELTIRSRDAHAWVEVWDEDTGWFTVDPTPEQAGPEVAGGSLLASAKRFLHKAWAAVTTFDASSRDAAFEWGQAKLTALGVLVRENPTWFAGGCIGLLWFRRWWRRRGLVPVDPAVEDYLDVVARLRLDLRPGETPRQLLVRAAAQDLAPDGMQDLTAATERHERARYG